MNGTLSESRSGPCRIDADCCTSDEAVKALRSLDDYTHGPGVSRALFLGVDDVSRRHIPFRKSPFISFLKIHQVVTPPSLPELMGYELDSSPSSLAVTKKILLGEVVLGDVMFFPKGQQHDW